LLQNGILNFAFQESRWKAGEKATFRKGAWHFKLIIFWKFASKALFGRLPKA